MDDDIKCPHCGTTKYRSPSLKLLVNVCGHALCENCVELLFVKGSASCPKCNVSLRKTNFRLQLFDDHNVEKEVDIRRRILKQFNKHEQDFDTFSQYNDYLEEIETIIFNLANNVDVVNTNKKIETYKKENAIIIERNKGKLTKDQLFIEELLEQEKEREMIGNQLFIEEDLKTVKTKNKLHEALVDELMFSDLPAHQILATHTTEMRERLKQQPIADQVSHKLQKVNKNETKMFSTGIKLGKGSNVFEPLPKTIEVVAYEYIEPKLDINGPQCPRFEALSADGYLNHVRSATNPELSGGFLPHYPCYRALCEAFCGLYFKST